MVSSLVLASSIVADFHAEVVKYMVYNRRKRGGDNASEYFNNTAMVAGVKDARHQALMPDVFHWLGIKHITNLISMSNLKYDALIASGITVKNRYEIPDELIPADSRVEIDAKVRRPFPVLENGSNQT